MAKAGLLEPQSPAIPLLIPRSPCLQLGATDIRQLEGCWRKLPGRWAVGSEPTQGDERGAYVVLLRLLA